MPRLSAKAAYLADVDGLFVESVAAFVAADIPEDADEAMEMLVSYHEQYIESKERRYIMPRYSVPKSNDWLQTILPAYEEPRFRTYARCSRSGFAFVLSCIQDSTHFKIRGNRPQQPVSIQLLAALNKLGTNGNGTSFSRSAGSFGTSEGNIWNQTKRVVNALYDLRSDWIQWGNEEDRLKESQINFEREGFAGCVGKVDGTCVVLAFRPGM